VLGCEPLGFLLGIEVLGLLLFTIGFDVLDWLLLAKTRVLDLLIVFVEARVLGFILGTGGMIFF
jgi:hypothetical protein